MAHPINDAVNRLEKRKLRKCTKECAYWRFPHLDTACVLSSVFSVRKNELCYEYKQR